MLQIRGKKLSHKARVRCIAAACLLALVGGWLWFTRPVTTSQRLHGNPVPSITVIKMITPPGGPSQMYSVRTKDGDEIQELLTLLDSYPDNRKFDWSWLLGPNWGYWSDGETSESMLVDIPVTDSGGSPHVLRYIVSDRGRLQVFEPGRFGDVPAGVGRFGREGTKRYFAALYQFYEQKEDSPLWSKETIRGADDPPDAAS